MPTPMRRRPVLMILALAAGLATLHGHAQTANPPVRVRGDLVSVTTQTLTVRERSGELIELTLTDKTALAEVYPITLADIQPGSFIGTAAMPQADGSQRAIAVTVFPEEARGLAEGHRPFDLRPQSTMTNATVADVVGTGEGRRLQVRYQGGEKTIEVPADAPIVSFRSGDRSLLQAGASVSVIAVLVDGRPTATRVNAGKNGFRLPY